MRSLLYSVLYAVTVGSMALGPALAALLFVLHGNEWSATQLTRICVAGLVRGNAIYLQQYQGPHDAVTAQCVDCTMC